MLENMTTTQKVAILGGGGLMLLILLMRKKGGGGVSDISIPLAELPRPLLTPDYFNQMGGALPIRLVNPGDMPVASGSNKAGSYATPWWYKENYGYLPPGYTATPKSPRAADEPNPPLPPGVFGNFNKTWDGRGWSVTKGMESWRWLPEQNKWIQIKDLAQPVGPGVPRIPQPAAPKPTSPKKAYQAKPSESLQSIAKIVYGNAGMWQQLLYKNNANIPPAAKTGVAPLGRAVTLYT